MTQPRLPIVILEEAEQEAAEAYDWYLANGGADVAHGFRVSLSEAMSRVAARPETYPRFEGDVRRCLFGRYPYAVLYEVNEAAIVIVAFMHLRRRPGYWQGRPQ